MTVPTDPFTFNDGGSQVASGVQVNSRFAPLYAALNGALDVDNLLAAVKDKLGLSDATTVRRGKSIIVASEARTNVAYGLLTTPDQVSNVVLPQDGLILVTFQAIWNNTISSAGRAAIFLNGVQLAIGKSASVPVVQEATGGVGGADAPLCSTVSGLLSGDSTGTQSTEVTTGQLVALSGNIGGACAIFAAAGTYNVSVQFRATSGTVNVQRRKLWVEARAF